MKFSRYTPVRALGSGTFGSVVLALDGVQRRAVAIKRVLVHSASTQAQAMQEVEAMRSLSSHAHVLKCYEATRAPLDEQQQHVYYAQQLQQQQQKQRQQQQQRRDNTGDETAAAAAAAAVADETCSLAMPYYQYLVLEYAAGGDLLHYLTRHGVLSEARARGLFSRIVSAVHYAHQLGLCHRDLKLENILLDARREPRVADWGFAARWSDETHLTESCGSVMYAAPEIFRGEQYRGPEVDAWSLGVLLYILVAGRAPFPGESAAEVYAAQQQQQPTRHFPSHFSRDLCCLLSRLLSPHAAPRASLHFVFEHPWMRPNLPTPMIS